MPWKPVMTATSPSSKRALDLAAVDPGDAGRAVRGRGRDRDLPALPGARLQAHRLQHDREETGRHLLAGGDDGVVLARVMQDEASRTQATSWLVTPAMAETTTATSLPPSTSRFT